MPEESAAEAPGGGPDVGQEGVAGGGRKKSIFSCKLGSFPAGVGGDPQLELGSLSLNTFPKSSAGSKATLREAASA